MEQISSSSVSSAVQQQSIGRLVYVALLIGLIPQGLVEAAITAALPEMSKDLGVNGELAAQMMLGMSALGLTIGALVSGRVLEWAGARTTFLSALLAFGVFGSGGMFLHDATLLFATRVIIGIAASCLVTTCLWGISFEFSGNSRARVFSAAGAVGGIATLIAIVLGGFLTQHLGWRLSFIQYPVFSLIALPIALGGITQRRPEGRRAGGTGYLARLVPFYIMVVVFYAVIGMSSMQLPFLLNANGATEAGSRSLIQAIPGLAAIFGAVVYGILQHRVGASWSFVASLACFLGGLLLLAISHSLTLPAIGAGAVGLCMGLSGPYYYHTISERTDIATGGRYIGYLNACTYFGVFLNPLFFEPVKARVGMHGLYFLAASIVAVLGTVSTLGAARAGRPRSASRQA